MGRAVSKSKNATAVTVPRGRSGRAASNDADDEPAPLELNPYASAGALDPYALADVLERELATSPDPWNDPRRAPHDEE